MRRDTVGGWVAECHGALEEDEMDGGNGEMVWGMRRTLCKAEDEIAFWCALWGKQGIRREKDFHGDQSRLERQSWPFEATARWNVLLIWWVTWMKTPENCGSKRLFRFRSWPKYCTVMPSRRSWLEFTAGCHGYLRFATPAQWPSSHVGSFVLTLFFFLTLNRPHFILCTITSFHKQISRCWLIFCDSVWQ